MNAHCRFLFHILIAALAIRLATAGEYTVRPQHSVAARSRAFVIEQRALVEDDQWAWQAWVCPAPGGGDPWFLPLWHEGELSWPGDFYISPDEKAILHIQKSGSAANDAAILTRHKDGKFALSTLSLFSERAWEFFRRCLGRDPMLSRGGMKFVSWDTDGGGVELSLHCAELGGGGYIVKDWRFHLQSGLGQICSDPGSNSTQSPAHCCAPRQKGARQVKLAIAARAGAGILAMVRPGGAGWGCGSSRLFPLSAMHPFFSDSGIREYTDRKYVGVLLENPDSLLCPPQVIPTTSLTP